MDWYYAVGDKQKGPVSESQLQAAYEGGEVTESSLVWCEGMANWLPFAEVAAADDDDELETVPAGSAPAAAKPSAKRKVSRSGGKKFSKKRTSGGGRRAVAATAAAAGGGAVAANPYAAPQANVTAPGELAAAGPLATPVDRLLAQLLDGVLGLILVIPVIIGVVVGGENGAAVAGGLMLVLMIGLFAFQLTLLFKHSATWGKRMMKIYIADMAGNKASPGKIIGMRYLVNGLIGAVVPFYGLVDILFIFREDRRCIHDMLAGTQVLKRAPVATPYQ